MNYYNWPAINAGIEANAELWKTRKCGECETFDDIVAFIPLESDHTKRAILHGCAVPMTPSALAFAESVKVAK